MQPFSVSIIQRFTQASVPPILYLYIYRMMLKVVLCTWLFFQVLGNVNAQTSVIDSLKQKAEKPNHDTIRAQALSKLLIEHFRQNDSAVVYQIFNQGMKLTSSYDNGSHNYPAMQRARIAMLINVSYFEYMNLGTFESAELKLNEAINVATAIHDSSRLMRAHINFGIMYKRNARYLLSIDSYQTALGLSEKIKDKTAQSDILNNIANIKANLGKHDEVIALQRRALRIRREINNEFGIAVSLMAIGMQYHDQWQLDSAKFYLQKSLEATSAEKNPTIYGQALAVLGNVYLTEKDYETALKYLRLALRIRQEFSRDEEVFSNLLSIAQAEMEMGLLTNVESTCLDCRKYAEATNNITLLMSSAKCLNRYYEKTGNLGKAYLYFKDYIKYNDSIQAGDRIAEIEAKELELEYIRKKMDDSLNYVREKELQDLHYAKEMSAKQQEVNSVERTRNVLLAGGLVLVFFILFLFRTNRQKQKANRVIQEQKQIIEERHKETTDSINYARRIQEAVLVSDEYLQNMFTEHFVLYQPKDIVSGDFYWAHRSGDLLFWAVADCTGHGVPGALMSMIGSAFLNEIIIEKGVHDVGEILTQLRTQIIQSLNKKSGGRMQQDGMDIALCSYNHATGKLNFAGANNPLLVIHNQETVVLKSDKMPVGYYHGEMVPFKSQSVMLSSGDMVYIFSDGIQDQFGGPKAKKLKFSGLLQIIEQIKNLPLAEQKDKLGLAIADWKGDQEQLDDICMIGVKIST